MAENDNPQAIRLFIDGHWTATELTLLLRGIDDIYNLAFILEAVRLPAFAREALFPIDRRRIANVARALPGFMPLSVPRISYASPGLSDLAGVAKALKHVKDLLLGLVDRGIQTRQRRLENEAREIANQKALVEIVDDQRERDAKFLHHAQLRTQAVTRATLQNQLLREEVRAKTVANVEREVAVFSKSISTLMRRKELSGEEQAQIVRWIGSRMLPLGELADAGKFTSVDEISVEEEQAKTNRSE